MISAFRLGPAASGRRPFDIDSYTSRYETSNPPCDFNIKLILFHFLYPVVRITCVRKKVVQPIRLILQRVWTILFLNNM